MLSNIDKKHQSKGGLLKILLNWLISIRAPIQKKASKISSRQSVKLITPNYTDCRRLYGYCCIINYIWEAYLLNSCVLYKVIKPSCSHLPYYSVIAFSKRIVYAASSTCISLTRLELLRTDKSSTREK